MLNRNKQCQCLSCYNIHTDKSLATPHFFGDTVLEVAERNMWVMEIK